MTQFTQRSLTIHYSIDQVNRDFYDFWSELIFELKKKYVVTENRLPESEYNYISLINPENLILEVKSCDFVIEDTNTGEFWILSTCDQIPSSILSAKDNPYLKKVLFSQYVPDQIVHHVGNKFEKFEPWIYFTYNDFDVDKLFLERQQKDNLIPKMIFGGSSDSRPILNHIDSNLLDKKYMKDYHEYLQDIIEYRLGLSIGGAAVGDICYRDIEYMALGIPFIKFNYVTTLNPPLIPNYHYISVPFEDLPKLNDVHKDRLGSEKHGKLLEKKFNDIIGNQNFLNYVSTNAKKYYEQFLSKKNRTKYTIELLDFGNNNIDVIENKPKPIEKLIENSQTMEDVDTKVTIVTALYDLGRGNIDASFNRKYEDYLNKFSELLKTDIPMFIFIDEKDEEFIWKYRKKENTKIELMSLEKLMEWFEFTDKTNNIRQQESWYNQASWLKESPQARLKGYNPLVMSKMFMLNNVTIWNPFNSEYFFWIDAGITNTVHPGYFTHDKVFNKLPDFLKSNSDFVFLTYPYEGGEEIHGFPRKEIARYCNTDYVNYVCRGGFFGGKKQKINEINGIYYSYLQGSLSENLMGTEESVFTIIMYNNPTLITQFMIGMDGMVWRFFEDIKDENYKERVVNKKINDANNTALYVITFNSPKQFETLIESMIQYDGNFIDKPKKYLLNNSSDESTFTRYEELCAEYEFVHIKKDNLGICGGRQFIAEHADQNGFDYYFFFEDDMFFYPKKGEICRNGFNRYVENFYDKVLQISHTNEFDFLKFNYSEFFGDNGVQWSWYNVPQDFREKHWPHKNKLPQQGLDPNAPRTKFNNIKNFQGIPYADGEIYYSNWPQLVSRQGNKKMFLETTWAHPFEQTWMSYIFQETIKGNINPCLLLMTPTEHNRFDFYAKELRKES